MSLDDFKELELLSITFPGEPWNLTAEEASTGYRPSQASDYAQRLKQGRKSHGLGVVPIAAEGKERRLTVAERMAALDAFADRLLMDESGVGVADRLIHLRHKASELELNLRDADLQRRLWTARRRKAGAVEMFTSEMEEEISEDTWAWDGILMAGDSNLIAALPKVGKTSLLIDAIAKWHGGATEHLGRRFYGPCPPVIIVGTDMPRRRWLKLLARFGLAREIRPKVFGLVKDGPVMGLFSQDSPLHLDSEGIAVIAELAAKHPGALLIVDSYAQCTAPLGLKEASNDFAGPLTDLLEAVAPYGITTAAIHHSGHARSGEGAVAASRGSTALPAAVSQVVALSWLNKGKNTSDRRVVLQTEGRGGEPLQLLIEQEEAGWLLHGDAAEVFEEQRLADAEDDLHDRQAIALDLVRERWEQGQQRTTSGDLIEVLGLKGGGRSAPRIALRTLNQLARRGLLDSSKESTGAGAVVWFWPLQRGMGVTSSRSLSALSGVSEVLPPTSENQETEIKTSRTGREVTPQTEKTGRTVNAGGVSEGVTSPLSGVSPPPEPDSDGWEPIEVVQARGREMVTGLEVGDRIRRSCNDPPETYAGRSGAGYSTDRATHHSLLGWEVLRAPVCAQEAA